MHSRIAPLGLATTPPRKKSSNCRKIDRVAFAEGIWRRWKTTVLKLMLRQLLHHPVRMLLSMIMISVALLLGLVIKGLSTGVNL